MTSHVLLVRNLGLLCRVTRRDLAARYAGSSLGATWALLYPLILLGVYAVVYVAIFQVRLPGMTRLDYVLHMFAGLVPFLATGEAVLGGIGSITANRHLLVNTTFPIDLVPARAVLASQVTFLVGFTAVVVTLAATGRLHATIVLLPLVWGAQVLALCGAVWILSIANVVVRDLQALTGVALMVLLIASPIAYTPAMVPAPLAFMVSVNPFAAFVLTYQQITVAGQWPSLMMMLTLVAGSVLMFLLGGWWFARAKAVMVDHV